MNHKSRSWTSVALFFLSILLIFPKSLHAQIPCGSPCIQFGTVSTIPAVAYSPAFYNDSSHQISPYTEVSGSQYFQAQWPGTILPYARPQIPVTFSPTAAGSYSGTLSETYRGAGSTYEVTITITVAATYNPPLSGYINPKYVVVGVVYAPPGPSSSVTYANTTSVGSTTTIMHSFQSDVGFSVSISATFGIPAAQAIMPGGPGVKLTYTQSSDYTQGSSTSTTNTVSKASGLSYVTAGAPTPPPPPMVPSDYDFIWLWINPVLLVTYTPANGANPATVNLTGYAFDPTDPASGEPPASGPYISGPHVVEVQVGCLTGHTSCPSTLTLENGVVTSGTLARAWADNEYVWPTGEGPGLTSADIANILTFDPFVPSNDYTLLNSFPSTSSDGRFTKEPYPPNDIQYPVGAPTEMYNTVQMNTSSVASGTTRTIKQAFGLSEEFGSNFFDLFDTTTTLMESQTLTWNYSYLNTLTTSTTLTDALSIKGPPDPPPVYDGATEFVAYQDNIFGTFAFVPLNP